MTTVFLSIIARAIHLNGIQNAMLNACRSTDGLEGMLTRMTWRDAPVRHDGADELHDPIHDAPRWAQHVTARSVRGKALGAALGYKRKPFR